MRRLAHPTALIVLAMLAAAGCNEFGEITDQTPSTGPATIVFDAAPGTDQVVGADLQITVRVTNAADEPVSGEDVTFTVTLGGGSVSQSVVGTGSSGSAATTWTLGTTVGDQAIEASVAELSPITTTVTAGPGPVADLTADVTQLRMAALDETVAIQVSAVDAHGNDVTDPVVQWSSSNRSVAEVADGEVTAAGNGTATITARSGDGEATVNVTVEQEPAGLEMDPSTMVYYEVPTALSCTVVDANGYEIGGEGVSWSSANVALATVDASGQVTGHRITSVAVTATADADPGISDQMIVQVVPRPEDAIDAGGHTCVLDANGEAWCWGYNRYGQLGNDGTSVGRENPQQVAGGHRFAQIATGRYHSCGLTDAGVAYCWGHNGNGEVGDATFDHRATPTPVTGGHTFTALFLGYQHSCGLTATNAAYCWGEDADGTSMDYATPVAIAAPVGFTDLAPGRYHTCGLGTDGNVYCWGENSDGQFGDGSTTSSTDPVNVGNPHQLVDLTAGAYYTCGLNGLGEAYCWGYNVAGQLGDGTTEPRPSPVRAASGMTFDRLTAFYYTTCGVSGGGVACWGWGERGNLGTGAFASLVTPGTFMTSETLTAVAPGVGHTCGLTAAGGVVCSGTHYNGQQGTGGPFMDATPGAVSSDPGFESIDVGAAFACALTFGGSTYCWGSNWDGELGQGVAEVYAATPQQLSTSLTFERVVTGALHACGLTSGGTAYCWGANMDGQLGDGTTAERRTPTAVAGGYTFKQLAAGAYHTCGITTSDAAYCWGYGPHGQLGDGNGISQSSPVPVSGGYSFTELAGGGYHTCGNTVGGDTYCWGFGLNGELGYGAANLEYAPVLVSGGHNFTSLVAHYYGTCGLTGTGAAYCWGRNDNGQVGNGATDGADVLDPAIVAGGLTFDRLDAFGYRVCGITPTGSTYCWGSNVFGGIGDGGMDVDHYSPTLAAGGMTFTDIAVGNPQTCGISTGGATYCWGHYGWGYLGNGQISYASSPQAAATGSFTVPHPADVAAPARGVMTDLFRRPAVRAPYRSAIHRLIGGTPEACEGARQPECPVPEAPGRRERPDG